MKKTLLLSISFLLFFTLTSQAQSIVFHDYGDGLAFPINESGSFDINDDGFTDILINTEEGKLGLKPIFFQGCVLAHYGIDATIDGVRLKVLEEGDLINMDPDGSYFEEDEVLPLYGGTGNIYPDWDDNEPKYIGLMSFETSNGTGIVTVRPAWMKIKVDIETETLYILSLAYNTENESEILAGQTENTTVGLNDLQINDLSLFPNPASDMLTIELELAKANAVSFSLNTMNGQQVKFAKRELIAGKTQERMDVSDLASGVYQLVIESDGGLLTKTVTISK